MTSLFSLPPPLTEVDEYLNFLFLFPNQYFSKSIECWNVLEESGNVGNSEFFFLLNVLLLLLKWYSVMISCLVLFL